MLKIVEGWTDADVPLKPAWRGRKETYITHVLTTSASLVLVSASDKLHNAGRILSDYRDIEEELWDRFNKEAGRAGTIGYAASAGRLRMGDTQMAVFRCARVESCIRI